MYSKIWAAGRVVWVSERFDGYQLVGLSAKEGIATPELDEPFVCQLPKPGTTRTLGMTRGSAMRSCKTCGKRMKRSSFGTEVCSECTKHWEDFFAEENALCETSPQASTCRVDEELEDLDLDRLLASVRFGETEYSEVFSQVWVPTGYPGRSLAVSALLHVATVFLLYGLSGISFQRPLSFTRSELEKNFQITYYRPSDLLPKIKSISDGPKDPAGRKRGIKPPTGSTSSPETNHSISSTKAGQFSPDYCSAQHAERANQTRGEGAEHGGLECSRDKSGNRWRSRVGRLRHC
jgi:hypothetical protein